MVSAYDICEDCAMWHANNDLSGVDDPVRVAEVMRGDHYFAVDCGEDDEFCTAFSWSACDACGTRLGGARHRAWLID